MDSSTIIELVNKEVFGIWFLIGAALVFFMQAGFAMVETGFTRAKNAGNIIMKNLMDFCIGTPMFMLLGFSIMMSEDYVMGVIGVPNLDIFTNFGAFMEQHAASFVFNLVFCATAATIVSGAMAERTKFLAYCVYSGVISLFIYPIEAGWIWNSQGWLAQLGFHDFAGSCAIHMVGGISALIGAAILGPRLGKYTKEADGKIKVHAIPGHSIPLGALGCFILWFGWYGFNGAAAWDGVSLGSIFFTTTIAPAVATVVCMIFTWVKNGKPDVSMCLNASLAGLVGITAGCDALDGVGATVVGIVSGILVVVVVELLDLKLHIDDPVGAVGVHCANGIWGTVAVGLLANPEAPAGLTGLFYGAGGARLLGVQLLGILAVGAWTALWITLTFLVIKKTIGLRASREEEIEGLDQTEHGLPSAYADFVPAVENLTYDGVPAVSGSVPAAEAVEIKAVPAFDRPAGGAKFTKVEIICRERMLETLKNALVELGITGMTVSHVMGCGAQHGRPEYYRGVEVEASLLPKVQLDVVVSKIPVRDVIETAKRVLYTGHIGDGKIFVYDVENVVKVRTGEEGYAALQDVE